MVNWTTGSRNLVHALDLLGVERVITAKALLAQARDDGHRPVGAVGPLRARRGPPRAGSRRSRRLPALVRSHLDWAPLRRADADARGGGAVHQRVGEPAQGRAADARQPPDQHPRRRSASCASTTGDVLIGMLPPFHSFGITVTTILPLCTGHPHRVSPEPDRGGGARPGRSRRIGVTLLVGTPTFLNGIVRAARAGQLDSLRFAVTGAEKCPRAGLRGAATGVPAGDDPRGLRHHRVLADRVGQPAREVGRRAASASRWRRSSARSSISSSGRAGAAGRDRACCSCAGRASSAAT